MESISPSHNEGSISPSIPHSMMPFTSHMKPESTDPWNFQILNSSGMVQDNNPSFTTLESVHPNSSYASSVVQYIQCNNPSGPFNSFSNLQAIQDIHDNSSLHDSYRNEDIPFSARDEGLGSSPSSFNSSTPPLNPPAAAQEQQLEVISLESLSNYNCQRTNERSSSEDFGPAVLMNPPMVDVPFTCLSRRAGPGSDFQLRSFKVIPKRNDSAFEDMLAECGKCGIRVNVTWYGDHYLCEACCLDRTRQLSVPQTEDAQNDKKRKRSATVNKKENQICSNCKTTKTTLWRRSADGRPVCNACGLYEKLHKCERPVAMRKDVVQTRKRKPKATQSRQRKKSPSKAQQGFQRVQACPSNYQEQQQLPNYGSIQMKSVPVHANPVRHSAPLPSMNVNDAAIWCANYTLEMYNQNHPYLSVSPYEVMDEHDARLPFPNSTGS